MSRTFQTIGALMALLAVAAGAFGAHSLKSVLEPDMLTVFEVGARYQMYHALALLFAGTVLLKPNHSKAILISGWAFVCGIVLFSGSLYLLAVTGIAQFGMITPLGGIVFLVGWFFLAIAIIKS